MMTVPRMRVITIFCGLLTLGMTHLMAAEPATTPATITPQPVAVTRIKDIAHVQGARDNQLLGYGLVVGLNGTGDSSQTEFTTLALANMLKRLNVTVQPGKLKAKNVAAVMVTADIPPFMRSGDRIDIAVSSLGDATNLQGGMLLQTPLMGADSNVYAVAQGPVSLGGYAAAAGGSSKTAGHPTVGRIPNGALVEAEIPYRLSESNTLTFSLLHPDFTTAARMAAAINTQFMSIASARDAAAVDVHVPEEYQQRLVDFIALIGETKLVPDAPAKVVMNERTGTVVVGGNVIVSPVAIAQGNLTVTITPELWVSQPLPFSDTGKTVSKETAEVAVTEPTVSLAPVRGTTVDELVRMLNAMKVSPRDLIAIMQALKAAGALQAELEIL